MPEQTDNTPKRRRHRLDAAARHELAVIDRVLVGNHTEGADDAEIAEFALRLRAERPMIGDDARSRLDARFAERIAEERRAIANPGLIKRLRDRLPVRLSSPAPLAGALATLMVVAGVTASLNGWTANEAGTVSSGSDSAQAPESDQSNATQDSSDALKSERAGAVELDEFAKSAPATAGRGTADAFVPAPNQSTSSVRRVERSADLTLATPSADVEDVADDVIATTDRFGGFVESSSVSGGDAGNAAAQFTLRLPSNRFQEALASLSGLAHVRERTQSTQDVTDAYERAADRLKSARAESNRLRAKLAATTDEAEAKILRARLRTAEARESARRREMQQMRNRVNYVTLGVTIVADETAETAGQGTIGRALDKAGEILTEIAAIAIVSMAILAPLALLALAIGSASRRIRRTRDEATIESAAAPAPGDS